MNVSIVSLSQASEYVVYGTSQQRIRYLVEFKMASDMEKEKDDEKVHEVSEELDSDSDEKEEETNDGEKITSQIFCIMLIVELTVVYLSFMSMI